MLNVGLVFNTATEELLAENPELTLNLTDAPETIDAVAAALEYGGHAVTRMNADRNLPSTLTRSCFDIVFNIATGIYGDTRQANVPAMLEYLRIPHTGSGVLAEAITNYKPTMKLILSTYNLPTPTFQVFHRGDEALKSDLRFPLIVKLSAEGGSLGLDKGSIVYDEMALRERVRLMVEQYRQVVLVEEFIAGQEFTVSVLGNDPPYTLPVVERVFFGDSQIMYDEPEGTTLRELERLTGKTYTFTPTQSVSVCPARVPMYVTACIQETAIAAYSALHCQDWARIDMRMNAQGELYIIDVNLEPAIAPEYALARSAGAAGWSYEQLVNRILEHALERYPHLEQYTPLIDARTDGLRVWGKNSVFTNNYVSH